jgi:hypothetical protein
MHRADAGTHHHAAHDFATRAAAAGKEECERSRRDREQQGKNGAAHVVTHFGARIEAEHCDEVHRPDAQAHRHRSRGQPRQSPTADMCPDAPEHVERGPRAEPSRKAGQRNENRMMGDVHERPIQHMTLGF